MNVLFRLVCGLVLLLGFSLARGAGFETGWLRDERGATDAISGASVLVVSGMYGVQGPDGSMQWRGRHVGLEIPVAQLDVKRLVIIGENGQPIPHKDPEAFASTLKSGKPGIYLKLFIERPPGFKFKLRAE